MSVPDRLRPVSITPSLASHGSCTSGSRRGTVGRRRRQRQRLLRAAEAATRPGEEEFIEAGLCRSSSSSRPPSVHLRAEYGHRGRPTTSRSSWHHGRALEQQCAPMYFVGWADVARRPRPGCSIPCLLSFLAYQDIHATVAGINSFAPDPTPPINLVFQVYHFMITMGPALAAVGLLAGLHVRVAAAAVRVSLRAVAAGAHRRSSVRRRSRPAGGRPRSGASHGSSTTS